MEILPFFIILLVLRLEVDGSCTDRFYALKSDTVLRIPASQSRLIRNITNQGQCKIKCLEQDTCHSVTYRPITRRCYLNKQNIEDDDALFMSYNGYHLAERICPVAGSPEQSKQRCKRRFAPPRSRINFIPGKVIQQNKGWLQSVDECKSLCCEDSTCKSILVVRVDYQWRCFLNDLDVRNNWNEIETIEPNFLIYDRLG